jgi:hypothetical protein
LPRNAPLRCVSIFIGSLKQKTGRSAPPPRPLQPFCCSPKKWMTTMRQFFDPFGNQTLGTSIKRSCIIPLDHRRTSRSRLWRENRSWRKNPGELFRNKKDIKKDTKTERSLGLHIISELLVSPLTHYHTILCHDQGL